MLINVGLVPTTVGTCSWGTTIPLLLTLLHKRVNGTDSRNTAHRLKVHEKNFVLYDIKVLKNSYVKYCHLN